MKPEISRLRPLCLLATSVLAAFVFTDPAAAVSKGGAASSEPHQNVNLSEPIAEVKFPAPKRYAVVQSDPGKLRRLYTTGEILFHPQNPTRYVVIQQVDAGSIMFRESGKGRDRLLRSGEPIPGFPGLTFVATVMLKGLEYRFKVVERITQTDPVLLSITGLQAVLEKEVLRIPPHLPSSTPQHSPPQTSQRKLDPELFGDLEVKELDENTYIVGMTTARPVIENVGHVLADLQPMITPAFSSRAGMSLNLTSAVGDGALSRSGFTVKNIKVAQFFGIQVGDTITHINGNPVSSPLSAWWAYQQVFVRNPLLSEVRVDLVRGGMLMTKTFLIR